MSIKDRSVTFKLSLDELAKLEQSRRQHGFKTKSPFLRHLINVAHSDNRSQSICINPNILTDFSIQLRRVNAALVKVVTLTIASKSQEDDQDVSNAVKECQNLLRKIYKAMGFPQSN